MTNIKINEQIAFLRKQKGMTQEELAKEIGVTNQTISKYESGQCCPDIQLLPAIAELFHVSVDELLGYTPTSATEDLILELRKKIGSLSNGEAYDFTNKAAAVLHTVLLSKLFAESPNHGPNWNEEEAIEHAGKAHWGYSSVYTPEITTTMRKGTVFFSNNRGLNFKTEDIRRIVSTMKPLVSAENLKIAIALYELTVHAEDAFTSIEEIAEKADLPAEKVEICLEGPLSSYVMEHDSEFGKFRFDGMYMNIIPLISLFDFR